MRIPKLVKYYYKEFFVALFHNHQTYFERKCYLNYRLQVYYYSPKKNEHYYNHLQNTFNIVFFLIY